MLADGSAYDVRWLLARHGTGFKVRDAMVLGFWMTPFLKKLFEDYIAQNGGNPRALTCRIEPLSEPRCVHGLVSDARLRRCRRRVDRAGASCRAPRRR